jgi:GxxExxY protein
MEFEKLLNEKARVVLAELGIGFAECIYQKALEYELRDVCMKVESEVVIPVYYRGAYVGSSRADLVVTTATGGPASGSSFVYILELKAVARKLGAGDIAQLKTYLRNNNLGAREGFLVNFYQGRGAGTESVEVQYACTSLG